MYEQWAEKISPYLTVAGRASESIQIAGGAGRDWPISPVGSAGKTGGGKKFYRI
jgi:hypothetical protein